MRRPRSTLNVRRWTFQVRLQIRPRLKGIPARKDRTDDADRLQITPPPDPDHQAECNRGRGSLFAGAEPSSYTISRRSYFLARDTILRRASRTASPARRGDSI